VPGNAAPASPAAHRLGNDCGHRCGSAIDRTILDRIRRILAKKIPDMLDGRLNIWL
jgi:hypothetical protein